MSKKLFIAEKPSVAKQFAAALKENFSSSNGYMESDSYIVTWCVGHLVNMSYPEIYDENLKKWDYNTIPFIPTEYKYEVIASASKQYEIVSKLLTSDKVDTIYVCTDSGREGEYIYRLVAAQCGVKDKKTLRVWIDSQTDEEILRGIREAKDISYYDNLSDAAYLRAQEDYLMGINFSRVLTLKYGYQIKQYLNLDKSVIAVGRVMTCTLGMVVRREREIRNFVKTPFYKVVLSFALSENNIDAEWKVTDSSAFKDDKELYKDCGFLKEEKAQELINHILKGRSLENDNVEAEIVSTNKKTEKKNAPLLYNLADLQNECSKYFKINPDQTLNAIQELYEKKLVTYPRTDARVLSTAVSKEITKNLNGLYKMDAYKDLINEIKDLGLYKTIAKTKYVNDKAITDHYAIIPTGDGLSALASLDETKRNIYELICRRFISIFLNPAQYEKLQLELSAENEHFFSSFKVLKDEGYLKALKFSFKKNKAKEEEEDENKEEKEVEIECDDNMLLALSGLKKGAMVRITDLKINSGETKPPTRYNSGSLIKAMESAGKTIDNEDLKAQMKGSGIGTSATRAGILTKLVNNKYLLLNNKTQIVTPTLLGEMICDVVVLSIKNLLNPAFTASWEMGLSKVADGEISKDEYTEKLNKFVSDSTNMVKGLKNQYTLNQYFDRAAVYYKNNKTDKNKKSKKEES